MTPEILANRSLAETIDPTSGGLAYRASIGRFADGRIAEIFLANHKAGSVADTNAKDATVVGSIALQFGVPVDVIRNALMRDSYGQAGGPLDVAVMVAELKGAQ